MPDANRSTAEPITAVIAQRVRAHRERAGLSQAELAEAMAARGVPWKRATVVNLEKRAPQSRGATGTGRDTVSVQELLTLARVLDVPPVLLIADPQHTTDVPLGEDGSMVSTWGALVWLIGSGSDDRDVIYRALALGDALREFDDAQRTSVVRDAGRLTRDPEAVGRVVEQRQREALQTIQQVADAARLLKAPLALPENVIERAAELGVDLDRD